MSDKKDVEPDDRPVPVTPPRSREAQVLAVQTGEERPGTLPEDDLAARNARKARDRKPG